MKTNSKQRFTISSRMLFFLFGPMLMLASVEPLFGQPDSTSTNAPIDYKIIVALNALNEGRPSQPNASELFSQASKQRKQTIRDLLKIFNNPNSYNGVRRYAAYYLGEMQAAEAIDSLVMQITLTQSGPISGSLSEIEAPWNGKPAANALVAIGAPSIPALIRSLSESDDANVRELSLHVLYRIEADKDIVQLRLQKTLSAEKDSQKQARLQAALKALAEASFAN